MKASHLSYEERQKGTNLGEELFEAYCIKHELYFTRLGFDSYKNRVPDFFNLNPYLRNLPDYVVKTRKGFYVVNVKGTDEFKQSEYNMLPTFIEWYGSRNAPLVYMFCFRDQTPIMIHPEKIIEMYDDIGIDQKYKVDGKIYRCLNLRSQKHGG